MKILTRGLLLLAILGLVSFGLSGCVQNRVTVPDVIGTPMYEAVTAIETKQLVVQPMEGEPAPEAALEEIVYGQDPPAFTEVQKETIVAIDYYAEYPESGDHKTDRVYKMLYVCPWYSESTGFAGLDQIKEIGFNTIHTYSPFQWEQNGWWDTPEGKTDCLRQVRLMLKELKKRDMYGCLQMPLRDDNLRAMAEVMAEFDNAIAGTVEEPDMTIPPNPTLEDQKRIYDTIKEIAPDMQVWGCFNGGQWEVTLNVEAYDVIITDSYCYGAAGGPVPGTPAAENGDYSLPWWRIDPWIFDRKIPMMHEVLPDDMGIINIQQGFYSHPNRSGLPNIEEEWNLYHEEFGLNSFAIYAHGAGQGMDSVWIMDDNRDEPYSLKNQCRTLMEKLDEMGGD